MLPALVAGGAMLGGSLLGEIGASGDRKRARKDRQRALEMIMGLEIPDIEKQRLMLDMEQTEQLGPSAMEGVTGDVQADADEQAVLERLAGITESGGMDMQSRSRLAQINDQVGQANRSRQEGILANMRNRGQLGGGAELAARMGSASDAATQANRGALQTAADAEDRYFEALQARGGMAGARQGRTFGQAAERARAKDAIQKFNAMNRQDVGMRNVNRRNDQQVHNKGLYQQDFQNRFNRASAGANALTGNANAMDQGAQRTADRWAGVGQAVGAGVNRYYEDDRYSYDKDGNRRR